MKALIVEDDPCSRLVISSIMQDYANCDTAVSGVEAFQMYNQALTQNEPYDLVFMDIMLPKMNGHDTIKSIRKVEDETSTKRVPVIVVSSLNDSNTIMKSFFDDGCEAYVTKPYKKVDLIKEIQKLGLVK